MARTPGTLPNLRVLPGKGKKRTTRLSGQPVETPGTAVQEERTWSPERVNIRILRSVLAIAIIKATKSESTLPSRFESKHT
jgi:hypothetical protein